jgi:hypothetical protein
VLDSYLKVESSSPIQLEILDSAGKLVRQFSSDDKLGRTDPDSVPYTVNWVPEPQPLSREAGMHRFVWDLRAAAPEGMRRSFRRPGGPWIVPGEYTVKLAAAGKTVTQPLTMKMDPRVKVAPEALQRQFALASQIGEQLSEVSAALRQAEDLRKQAEERKRDAAGNAAMVAALDEISAKIQLVLGPQVAPEFEPMGPSLPEREHEPLRRVSTALSGLLAVTESADVAPSSDLTAAAARWATAQLDSLAQWQTVEEQIRTRVNPSLKQANLKPLAAK